MRFIATFVALMATARAQTPELCGPCRYDFPCRGTDGGCYEVNWDTYECPDGTSYCPDYLPCRSPDGECYWENYDDETGESQCPDGTTRCAACVNSIVAEVDPNAIDDGCYPSAPVCVDDAGDSPALGAQGTACVAKCLDTSRSRIDQGCPQSLPFCTSTDGSDPGKRKPGTQCGLCSQESCDDKDPTTYDICDPTWGCSNWGTYDLVCTDTSRFGVDKGCNERFPTCMGLFGGNPGPGKPGYWCGCTAESCDDNDPSTEDICYEWGECQNGDNWDYFDGPTTKCVDTSRSGKDKNCPKHRPICTLRDGSDPGQNNPGVRCAKCSQETCDDNDPSTGDYCSRDEGCYHWDDSNSWGPVVECVDTSLSGTDKGCTKSQPICTLKDDSDPGAGKAGVQCSVCSLALCDDGDPSTDDYCDPRGGCYSLPKETCGAVSGEPEDAWVCADPLPFCTRDEWCYCITDVEGNPFCAEDTYCMYANSCTSSDECGSNMKCVSGCCGSGSGSCLYDCGSDNGYGYRRLEEYVPEPTVLGFLW